MLDSEYPENVSEEPTDDEKVMTGADDGKRNSNTEAFTKITLNVLRSMKQEQLADSLQSSKIPLNYVLPDKSSHLELLTADSPTG